MVRILLTNTNCSWNAGSAAQVISTVETINEYIKDANFVLISDNIPELDNRHCREYGVKAVGPTRKNPFSKHAYTLKLLASINSLTRSGTWAILKRIGIHANRLIDTTVLKEYSTSDLIIDLSGDSFSDYGNYSIFSILSILIGLSFGKKIALYSQSIGPFRRISVPLVKLCLNKSNLIVIREVETENILKKIGVNFTHTYLAPEIAFLLKSAPPEKTSEIFQKEGISKSNRPLIGLGTNIFVHNGLKSGNESDVILMANIADFLVEKIGAQVILIPHVIIPAQYNFEDDRFLSQEIFQRIKNKDNVRLINGDYTAVELKGIIGQCDLFIGTRMHSNIASTSMYIPTVALSWSHKYHGIMRMLGQEEYCCDFRIATFDDITQKISAAWQNKSEIREELILRVPEIKKSAFKTGELIKNLIN